MDLMNHPYSEREVRVAQAGREELALFGVVMKGRHGGTPGERSARRMRWQPPDGVNIVGGYWFPTDDPSIVEAEDPATVEAIRLA